MNSALVWVAVACCVLGFVFLALGAIIYFGRDKDDTLVTSEQLREAWAAFRLVALGAAFGLTGLLAMFLRHFGS